MFLEKDERDRSLKPIKSISELMLDSPMVVAYMTREKPEGQIDDLNTRFFLSHEPINASEHVYLNGLLLEYGSDKDYIMEKNCVIFNDPPQKNDKLVVTYRFQL